MNRTHKTGSLTISPSQSASTILAVTQVQSDAPPPHVHNVLRQFCLEEPQSVEDFDGKGNIHNDSYLVKVGQRAHTRDYILQRINDTVFTQPWNVMAAMIAAIDAQGCQNARRRIPEDIDWHAIELVRTLDSSQYTHFDNGPERGYWRLMVRIPECRTYKSLSQVEPPARPWLAEQAGRGMAIFTSLAASIDTSALKCPLPGYRDTRLYYDEFQSVLSGNSSPGESAAWLPADDSLRQATSHLFCVTDERYLSRRDDREIQEFIEIARTNAEYALTIQRALECGRIRTTAVHGDTKLENFLFCKRTGMVKALVDLDTIMPHTWLSDWGDMVRSFVNVAGECEPDLNNVGIDEKIFDAVARGFLGTASDLPENEIELMVDAAQIMTLELGVRFLTDYLRGDNYFKLESGQRSDLNKIRGCVQLRLFQHLRDRSASLKQHIAAIHSDAAIAA